MAMKHSGNRCFTFGKWWFPRAKCDDRKVLDLNNHVVKLCMTIVLKIKLRSILSTCFVVLMLTGLIMTGSQLYDICCLWFTAIFSTTPLQDRCHSLPMVRIGAGSRVWKQQKRLWGNQGRKNDFWFPAKMFRWCPECQCSGRLKVLLFFAQNFKDATRWLHAMEKPVFCSYGLWLAILSFA